MPQVDVNCPYCNDEYSIEIENQSDGDIEEIDCSCGESFEAQISFSVDAFAYKKEEDDALAVVSDQKEKSK